MANDRIDACMTLQEAVAVLSEGNPGAMATCCEIIKHGPEIDPAGSGIMTLLHIDSLRLYGSRLYMLWNDVCGRDVGKTLAVIRGWQLGRLSAAEVNHAVDNRGAGIDMDDLLAWLAVELPGFNAAAGVDGGDERTAEQDAA